MNVHLIQFAAEFAQELHDIFLRDSFESAMKHVALVFAGPLTTEPGYIASVGTGLAAFLQIEDVKPCAEAWISTDWDGGFR